MGFTCFICKSEIDGHSLRWHFKNVHKIFDDNHIFTCYQDSCMRTFSRFSSYRKHLLATHSAACPIPSTACDTVTDFSNTVYATPVWNEGVQSGGGESSGVVGSDTEQDDMSDADDVDEFGVSKSAALFVANLHASSSVTGKTVRTVIENVSGMVKSMVRNLGK